MRFPLKIRQISGFKFRERTWYSRYHLGVDYYGKKWTPILAPCDGVVERHWGHQGGNTIYFHFDNKIMRVLHLVAFKRLGKVKEGDIIGYVGNTGILSRGSHAHIDISKNKVDIYNIDNFVDPELFFNNKTMKLIREKGRRETFTVINGKNYYIRNVATFEDLQSEGLINWEDVEEVNYPIKVDGVIAG